MQIDNFTAKYAKMEEKKQKKQKKHTHCQNAVRSQ